jgi:Na+-driven multidrug efflux pump
VAVFNIIFNYIFVFGHFGAPRMEIAGSALASVLAEIIAGIFAIVYMFKTIDIEKYQVFKFHAFDYSNLKDVLQIAAPVMLQMFISLSSWFIFFMIVEQMGERPLAISNLIRNAYMILMIPLIGLSSATNTLVSTLIGQKRYHEVFEMIKKIILMSFVLTLLSMLINVALANYTFGIFTNDLSLIQASIPSLYVISGSLMLFSIAAILLSSVSGSGNTPMSLIIEIITIIFYLFATWLVGVKWQLTIEWVWSVEYVYFIFMGGLSLLYLRKAKRNNFGQINL